MKSELKPGNVWCDKCYGYGTHGFRYWTERQWLGDDYANIEHKEPLTCPKCKGHKQLDWIELIVGKKKTSSPVIDLDINTMYGHSIQGNLFEVKK